MKLIIDIPEGVYKQIIKETNAPFELYSGMAVIYGLGAIKDGTILKEDANDSLRKTNR